ncbi:amidohydrolase [Bacillus solimangrovi]|uniref:Peptidase M20 dimerisation domain-containing protein n=1 Tax=Bacillus solimangrovi TaxID=1305675 RepID=A0A1E5LGR2_9BACI|nr:amidohydrolase [Bacillus solimangrovi]OEH93267.1 hypothetical protein BFG57_12775 [Bacillus solimangrovi]
MSISIEQLRDYVYQTQKYLHKIPEPAFKEKKTSTYIAKQLKEMGYEVTEHIAKTGVTAKLTGKNEYPCVAIRADMDCIVHEMKNEIMYRHSCGHDAHSSTALGIARFMKDRIYNLNGSVKFIFQPAEEIGEGAKAMTAAGVLEGVDYLIGYHLRTAHECPFGKMSPALIHSASCKIIGEIYGKTAHGGRPHLGINAIDVLSSLVTNINTIRFNPQSGTSVKFTQLHAGKGSVNVIPEYGTFAMDVRSGSNEELKAVIRKIEKMIAHTADMHDGKIEYRVTEGVPAPLYDENLMQTAQRAIVKILGSENVVDPIHTPGGEDFHYYSQLTNVKSIYLAIGANVCPGLHDPEMTFEKEAMLHGVEVISDMVEQLLSKGS